MSAARADSSAEPVDRGAAQVLVVEDDDAMRELVVEELTDAGFRVIGAGGGLAGIERAKQGDIDLVVTDLRMPDLDGFDLIRDIKATQNAPHIVMITAFGSIETAIRAVKLGAYDSQRRAVCEISQNKDGQVKFKLHDKKGALDSLARHLGMFKDKLALDVGDSLSEVLEVIANRPRPVLPRELKDGQSNGTGRRSVH